jgi:alpha-L-fucosidase
MLLEIGRWLKVNGDAIFGTRPWKVFGEGPTEVAGGSFTDTKRTGFTSQDIRFTRKGSGLYAIALNWPEDGKLTVKTLATGSVNRPLAIAQVELLGCGPVKWTQDSEGLHAEMPGEKPCEHPYALKITAAN